MIISFFVKYWLLILILLYGLINQCREHKEVKFIYAGSYIEEYTDINTDSPNYETPTDNKNYEIFWDGKFPGEMIFQDDFPPSPIPRFPHSFDN